MPVTIAERELADETIPASVGELSGDPAANRVNAIVRTLKKDRGVWVLTREKLEEILFQS